MREAKPPPANEWKRIPRTEFPIFKEKADNYPRIVKDDALAADILEKTIPLLKADRENYPGWLICPVRHRHLLRPYGVNWLLRQPVLDLLTPKLRAEALFELLWCCETGLLPLDAPLIEAMTAMLEFWSPEADRSLRLKFALALMRHARVFHDNDSLKKWSELIEAEAQADEFARQDAQYQLCLRARGGMDLDGVITGLGRLTLEDPIWKLRRAALHTEIGEYVKATKLIKDAEADLERRHRLDRNSLSIKSKLAWANWISRASGGYESPAAHPRFRDFRALDIDPLSEIEHFESTARDIQERRRQSAAVQPSFDAGYYRDGSGSILIRGGETVDLLYEFDQLTEFVGLPIRINHVNICAEAALAVLDVDYQPTAEWYVGLLRVLHSHYDDLFKRYFGRMAIAKLEADPGAGLISTVEGAIAFWTMRLKGARASDLKDDLARAIDMLRLLLVATSRLTVRMAEERAIHTFNLAIALAKDPLIQHPWLLDALGDVAKYAAKAIPVSRQGELALDAIEFPLASEKGSNHPFWPEVVPAIWSSTPNREFDDTRWDDRVRQLIAAGEKGSVGRKEATLRLAYLAIRNALRPDERVAFGRALWSDLDEDSNALPINTSMLPSTFAELPAADGIDAQARVQERLFEPDLRQVMSLQDPVSTDSIRAKQDHLIALANAIRVGLTLPASRAARMFDEIVAWELQQVDRKDPFAGSIAKTFNDVISLSAGELLALVVVPSMRAEDRTERRAEVLVAFLGRTRSWRGLGALPYFVASALVDTNDILSVIRMGLAGSETQHVGSAALAIARWAELVHDEVLQELPRPLVEQLIAMIETRQETGLQVLLSTALSLLKENMLITEDLKRLTKTLEKIRVEFSYEAVDFVGVRAASLSLIRAECVKLAAALKGRIADNGTLETWIEEAKSDPLPEVRLSLANS